MTRALMPGESDALSISGSLLKFAAEHNENIPQSVVLTICTAWDAQQANTWDQNIATDFWIAFNSLCVLIKPVTVDTLSTNLRIIPPPRWKFLVKKKETRSISERSAARYLFLLMILLINAVVLGFVISTGSNLISEIQKLMDSSNQLTEKIVSEIDLLEPIIGHKQFSMVEVKHQKTIARLQSQLVQQEYLLDVMLKKSTAMTRLMSLGFSVARYPRVDFKPASNIPDLRNAVRNYFVARRDVTLDVISGSISIGVMSSSVLPIFLGIMGACAYVIRLISDQIKDTTFATTSFIRNMVRVALGALAGVVIGFGGVASAGNLSPSALAFIAGYAVEPVFATFDSIAEKFRR
jgi:hypothetical protein